MARRVVNVSEARRDLPNLIRRVAGGAGPVAIGPRGRGTVVLVAIDEYEALRTRTSARGWSALGLELAGSPDELDDAIAEVRSDVRRSLEVPRASRPRPRRKGRA